MQTLSFPRLTVYRFRAAVFFFLTLGALLACPPNVVGGPLLQGVITNLSVSVGGKDYLCRLFPSQENEAVWYCVLERPFLAERLIDGVVEPELRIIRFQRPDPRNPNRMVEAGTIQCAFAVAPPGEVLDRLKSRLPTSGGHPVQIRPLPLSGMKLSIATMQGKKVNAVASPTQALASPEILRTASFNITLPTFDSAFMDVLVNEPTGIKYEFEYNAFVLDAKRAGGSGLIDGVTASGATPPTAGSSRLPERAGVATALPSRLPDGRSVGTPKPSLPAARPVRPSVTASPIRTRGPSAGDLRQAIRPGSQTKSAEALRKKSRSARDWEAFKRANAARTGWKMNSTGFLGLGMYPKDVRDRHAISESGEDGWRFAYLFLPVMPDQPGLPLESVTLDVTLMCKAHSYGTWIYRWTAAKGWRDADGGIANMARIPLKDLMAGDGDPLAEATFSIARKVECGKSDLIQDTETIPVLPGDYPLSSPTDLVDLVKLDFSLIDWMKPETERTRLTRVEVRLQEGSRSFLAHVQPRRQNGYPFPPEPVQWLVPAGSTLEPGRVRATIIFETADGKRIPWALNARPKDQDFSGGLLYFTDEDWKQ